MQDFLGILASIFLLYTKPSKLAWARMYRMPLTIAHPCAVLPFAKLCPRYLNFAALVCGSMSPDLAYAFQQYHFSAQAHTFAGSFLLDLPSGLVLLLIYYCSKDLIASQLPVPHRQFWLSLPSGRSLAMTHGSFSDLLKASAAVCLSLLVGSWTHIVWDSFTHQHGFAVESLPLLSSELFVFAGIHLQLYKILQYACSGAGLVMLALFYISRLKVMECADITSGATSNIKFSLLLFASSLAAVTLTLFQATREAGQSLAHQGFVLVVNCMFIVPVVFLISGIIERSRYR